MNHNISLFDRMKYSSAWMLEHLCGERFGMRDRANKKIAAKIAAKAGDELTFRKIPRVKNISRKDFIKHYYRKNEPVVLEGVAKDWPCVTNWSPQMISERYGDDPVRVIGAGPENIEAQDYRTQMTDLRTIIAKMETDCTKYARFNPLLNRHPELLGDLDVEFFEKLINKNSYSPSFQLFLGGKGSATALHNAITNNLFVEIYGEKEWYLISPRYNPVIHPPLIRAPYFISKLDPDKDNSDEFPEMRAIEINRCIINPGDILYIPSFYWHYVYNHSPTIGLGYRWFSPYSTLRSSITQGLLFLMSTNPTVFEAGKNRHDFTKIFELSKNEKPDK
jgi:hypothetical protein